MSFHTVYILAIAEEDNLIRDFQKETNTFPNPEKQISETFCSWSVFLGLYTNSLLLLAFALNISNYLWVLY